jgi:hypothetical protein
VNLSFNHTRTTDFHRDMMEYDIADTDWHTISYTDRKLDATPQDDVYAQLALYDAGRQKHAIEIAYFKVRVVDAATAPPDLGTPLPYRPPLPPLTSYTTLLPVADDAVIDAAAPRVNFAHGAPLLSVSASQMIILRWDFSHIAGKKPTSWATLALTGTNGRASGTVRVVEIRGGDPAWRRNTVTRDSFLAGQPETAVLNPQLIMDVVPGDKTLIEISPVVLKRLMSGEAKGLAIYAQGVGTAAFASSQAHDPSDRPVLYANVE